MEKIRYEYLKEESAKEMEECGFSPKILKQSRSNRKSNERIEDHLLYQSQIKEHKLKKMQMQKEQ